MHVLYPRSSDIAYAACTCWLVNIVCCAKGGFLFFIKEASSRPDRHVFSDLLLPSTSTLFRSPMSCCISYLTHQSTTVPKHGHIDAAKPLPMDVVVTLLDIPCLRTLSVPVSRLPCMTLSISCYVLRRSILPEQKLTYGLYP